MECHGGRLGQRGVHFVRYIVLVVKIPQVLLHFLYRSLQGLYCQVEADSVSSIPFFDAKDFPEDPDKLIAQFSPMVIDKAIALLPNRTRALECQQRVASLRSDEAVTYNELTAVKPEHMRQFERMVQKAILQPCPWLYLRFHSVSD